MKNLLILFPIIIAMAFSSCSKDEEIKPTVNTVNTAPINVDDLVIGPYTNSSYSNGFIFPLYSSEWLNDTDENYFALFDLNQLGYQSGDSIEIKVLVDGYWDNIPSFWHPINGFLVDGTSMMITGDYLVNEDYYLDIRFTRQ